MQPFELTQKTARSRVIAAAWIGSSWPGMAAVTAGAASCWNMAQPDVASAAAAIESERTDRTHVPGILFSRVHDRPICGFFAPDFADGAIPRNRKRPRIAPGPFAVLQIVSTDQDE